MQRSREQYLGEIDCATVPWPFRPSSPPIPRQEDQQVGSNDEAYHHGVSEEPDVSEHGANLLLKRPLLLRRELLQQQTDDCEADREERELNDASKASFLTAAAFTGDVSTTALHGGDREIHKPKLQKCSRRREIWEGEERGTRRTSRALPPLLRGRPRRRHVTTGEANGASAAVARKEETETFAAASAAGEPSPQAQRERTAAALAAGVTHIAARKQHTRTSVTSARSRRRVSGTAAGARRGGGGGCAAPVSAMGGEGREGARNPRLREASRGREGACESGEAWTRGGVNTGKTRMTRRFKGV